MDLFLSKPETRIIPGDVPPKFFAQHLKAYEFVSGLVKGKKVLEIGCGDGYGSYYLAEHAQSVIGVDYDIDTITHAHTKYVRPNLAFMREDATRLKFENKLFNVVCSFQVIEHIPEDLLASYLSEIRRVLKDGGLFCLSTPNLEHVMKSAAKYKKNPAHCREFRLEELRGFLSRNFSSVEIYGLHLTPRHRFYLKLKKLGLCNFIPASMNPVQRFYRAISTHDFIIASDNLKTAIDFYCVCAKSPQNGSRRTIEISPF